MKRSVLLSGIPLNNVVLLNVVAPKIDNDVFYSFGICKAGICDLSVN
jgi:hypothetical protein